jgi:predicted alpha-1,6-mannanase (GH76 family)
LKTTTLTPHQRNRRMKLGFLAGTCAILAFSLLPVPAHSRPEEIPTPRVADSSSPASKKEPYRGYADAAVTALQRWYNPESGTWKTTGWWNSANALEALIDYEARTGDRSYLPAIANTFEKNRAKGFLNEYYDDEGWWGLAWVKAYDLTENTRYLGMAKSIFNDMAGGWDDTFGGGVWWNKQRRYKNAIANELFLVLAARLFNRSVGEKGARNYYDWALIEWKWFDASGMINEQNLINDGLNRQGENNGGTTWTYNQGVILGGLTEMYRITRDRTYLKRAQAIADAALRALSNSKGTLAEPCESNSDCGGDGPQFKGIFVRYLGELYGETRKPAYRDFILRNADSIWANDRDESDRFGLRWAGPFDRADASRQSSAMDVFNAALR